MRALAGALLTLLVGCLQVVGAGPSTAQPAATGHDVYVQPRYAEDGSGRLVFEVRSTPPAVLSEEELLARPPSGRGGGQPPRRTVMIVGAEEDEGWRQFRTDAQTRADDGSAAWMATLRDGSGPQVYQTTDPARARDNLARLDAPAAARAAIQVVRGPQLDGLSRVPARANRARMVVILAANDAQLRSAVEAAARGGLIAATQVALITCGDAYPETRKLVEVLLGHGAILVWAPRRQITRAAAERLLEEILQAATHRAARSDSIDEIIRRALWAWYRKAPDDPDLRPFEESDSWVRRDPSVRGAIATAS